MDEKLSGSYYTPQKTVHFIYNYLQQQHKPIKSILEPSAGDGRFIRLFSKSNSVDNIVGVELYQEKVQAINERILSPKVTMIAADFLEYFSTCLISELASAGKKVYLLDLVGTKPDELPVSLKNYLSIVASTKRNGVEIQKSYKCSKRKPWYGVPIVKSGRVIFFKRYDLCPRISTNPAEIYTTDIAYNLRLHEGIDPESLVFCFYNSLTLAQCEFVGRYYAGGVSELTPNEFRTISVPYRQIKPCDIERVKTMFSNNVNLNQIVAFVNSKTLKSDLTTEEISRLNTIRVKLIGRRK